MGTTSSAIFTGSSQFSNDFQQVVSRAVQIATLPVTQMQSQVTGLQSQSSELNTIGTDLNNLQSVITSLNSALGLGSFTATSSSNTVATVKLSGTPSAGSITVEVDAMGAFSASMSKDTLTKVTDSAKSSISTATSYELTVGQTSYDFTPKSNTLSALADAINLNGGGNVQAMVINLGTSAQPDYRLSLQGTKLGDLPIQLSALGTDGNGHPTQTALLDAVQPPGSATTYRVNGRPTAPASPLSTNSNSLTLSPGVSVTLTGTGTATITVGRSTDAVSSALNQFVTAYNQLKTELDTNHGQGTGALKGQSVLATVSNTIKQIIAYDSGVDGVSSLTTLGLAFDKTGALSFDASQFSSATSGQFAQLSNFLGSTTTGGFLKVANDALNTLTDADSGVVQSSITSLQNEITKDNQAISDKQDQITTLQNNLNAQMAAADAAIAGMEQQYTYFYNMFTAMNNSNQGH